MKSLNLRKQLKTAKSRERSREDTVKSFLKNSKRDLTLGDMDKNSIKSQVYKQEFLQKESYFSPTEYFEDSEMPNIFQISNTTTPSDPSRFFVIESLIKSSTNAKSSKANRHILSPNSNQKKLNFSKFEEINI
jgi:hypothetical protein